MTGKKRMTLAERDKAALAEREAAELQELTPAAKAEAEPEAPAPAAKQPARRKPSKPAADDTPRIAPVGKSQWRQLSPRMHPDVVASFTAVVNTGEYGDARTVLTRALDEFFLTIDPVDDYTERLHAREQQRRARARR